MRNLLSTTALIAPFLVGAALAQDPPATTAPADPPVEEQTEEGTETLLDESEDDAETEAEIEAETEAEVETEVETEDQAETEPVDQTDPEPPVEATEDTTEDAVDETADDMTDEAAEPAAEADGETIVREQAPNELRVDWITGTRVRSLDGENIGRISDLIFDEESNAITVAILSVGGFLGIGAKQIAVKFDELVIDFDAREIQLDLTREAADAAPEYVFRDRAERPMAEPVGDPLPPAD